MHSVRTQPRITKYLFNPGCSRINSEEEVAAMGSYLKILLGSS